MSDRIEMLEARLAELRKNIAATEDEANRIKLILEAFRIEEILARAE